MLLSQIYPCALRLLRKLKLYLLLSISGNSTFYTLVSGSHKVLPGCHILPFHVFIHFKFRSALLLPLQQLNPYLSLKDKCRRQWLPADHLSFTDRLVLSFYTDDLMSALMLMTPSKLYLIESAECILSAISFQTQYYPYKYIVSLQKLYRFYLFIDF